MGILADSGFKQSMGLVLNVVFFSVYSILAVGVGMTAPVLLGVDAAPHGLAFGILAGAVVFLCGALLHEVLARREDRSNNSRRLILLKRAYDRSLGDLEMTRDEIRRIFEVIEAEGGDGLMERLRGAEARTSELESRVNRDGAKPEMGSKPDEMISPSLDPLPAFLSANPEPMDRPTPSKRSVQVGEDSSGSGDRPDGSAREMREVASEMRVLHSLVEQLYADRPPRKGDQGAKSALSAALAGPRAQSIDPTRGDGGRAGLRVVAGRSETPPPRDMRGLDKDRVLDIVREGLRRDRVDLYLQPIVSLPQRKRRFYECYSRIRAEDGTILGPDRFIDVARDAGLLTAVDNMLLFRCVQLLRKLQGRDINAVFFCNIAPNSLADREFFKDFIEYMEQHAELAPNLVLEIPQDDLLNERERLMGDFSRLGKLGYRFSLDRVRDLALDLPTLEEMHIHFVKIDAALILERLASGGAKATETRVLKQDLDEAEIDLIVERIETESQLVELLDFNIDYGQGFLFGEPRQSKDPGPAQASGVRA